ncbi:MAG: zinc ribbon domain-containing protein [Acidobacteriota bacterium]|nr:zinc ribbon domain-containing protein [Acidobacteriota bacterium]
MNCPECHQPLREGAQFCTRCGTHTSQGGVDSLSATQASADAAGESVPTVRRESTDATATGDSTPTIIESDPLVGRVLDAVEG